VDSVAFALDPEYKKELYIEFHGLLGEAAKSDYTTIGLVISKQGVVVFIKKVYWS
jgi:hypothetical protein